MTGKRFRKGWPVLALALAVVFAFSGCGPILYGEKTVQMRRCSNPPLGNQREADLKWLHLHGKGEPGTGEAFSAKHGKATVETSGTGSGDAPNSVIYGNASSIREYVP